ncbi:hypothetical protein [Saccharothrix obliqua]|uniref:hypothetical protein n=1 Tax=Saccharothrix obliqua TaxID=2861747 RepID=UPI001C5E94E0|nr:hypothetical protein [Saccharothrix obliqua]MBW4722297.1 hypothetical protein [Saccharothrix obliqua]
MSTQLDHVVALVKTYAEDLVDRSGRALPWIYWPCAVLCGLVLVLALPWVGIPGLVFPTILYWRTRVVGLHQVASPLYYTPFLSLLFTGFFAAHHYLREGPTGVGVDPWVTVGAVTFVVTTYGFAPMLERAHEAFEQKLQDALGMGLTPLAADYAAYRLLFVKTFVATTVVFGIADRMWSPVVLLVCVFALIRRNAGSAALAALVVFVTGVISYKNGQWVLVDWVGVVAVLGATALWIKAAANPFWSDADLRRGILWQRPDEA